MVIRAIRMYLGLPFLLIGLAIIANEEIITIVNHIKETDYGN